MNKLQDQLRAILTSVSVLIMFTDRQAAPEVEKKASLKLHAANSLLKECIEMLRKGESV
jgi:hypothetical protein